MGLQSFSNNLVDSDKLFKMIIVILINILTLSVLVIPAQSQNIITVPDDFPTIQEAINAANSGDTLNVKRGIYRESIVVNKQIIIVGLSLDETIIESDPTITVESNNVVLRGLTIRGTLVCSYVSNIVVENAVFDSSSSAIQFGYVSHSIISENSIKGNVQISYSSNNDIGGNIFDSNGEYNIQLWHSSDNTVDDNYCAGIALGQSSRNLITNNSAKSILIGSTPSYYDQYSEMSKDNVLSGNWIENGNGIVITNSSDNTVNGNIILGNEIGISLNYTNYNTISENEIASNNGGFKLESSSNNLITQNQINENIYNGIELYNSSDNIISENQVKNNGWYCITIIDSKNNTILRNDFLNDNVPRIYGISLFGSQNIKIFQNNFVNNPAIDDSINNLWNDDYPQGGNYWSDYTGIDERRGSDQDQQGSDGIGDTSYAIGTQNRDWYPLMEPTAIPEFSIWTVLPIFLIAILFSIILKKKLT